MEAEGGVTPPYSVFISRTSPTSTEQQIRDKLQECAENMPEGKGLANGVKLNFLSVNEITIKIPPNEERRSISVGKLQLTVSLKIT